MSLTDHIRAARAKGPPRFLDERFDAHKTPLNFPGNTIICHITQPNALATICAAQERLKTGPAGGCFAWLPESSMHCTLFNGLVYDERETTAWPTNLATDATREEADQHIRTAFSKTSPPDQPTLMNITGYSGLNADAIGLALTPDKNADLALRTYRDTLASASGLKHRPGHDTYQFHITLGYLVSWPNDDDLHKFAQHREETLKTLQSELPYLKLAQSEYCKFAELTHFDTLALRPFQ